MLTDFLTGGTLAYIDPGSGSIVFQVLLGTLAAAGVAIGCGWQSIKHMVLRLVHRGKPAESEKDLEETKQ